MPRKISLALLLLAALMAAFLHGGSLPPEPALSTDADRPAPVSQPDPQPVPPPQPEQSEAETAVEPDFEPEPTTEPTTLPAESEETTCTITISCAALLEHLDTLAPEKQALIPADGLILPPTTVAFTEGEHVFDVLQRVTQDNKIHLEFSSTPLYGSIYIEGIGNLYEFDCGPLSGWMYQVNGVFPDTGNCALSPGDEIAFTYACDPGADLDEGA